MIPLSALAFGGVVGGLLATAIGFAYWQVSRVSPFLYANARIQARSNFLVRDKKLNSLVEAKSLTELISGLQDSDYAYDLEKTKTLKEVHSAIEKNFVKSIEELKKMTPDNVDPLLEAYLMFWEAKMVKSIYRSKFVGEETELSEELVFPVGNLDSNLLKYIKEAKSLADLNVVMKRTVYGEVFSKEYENLEEFEIALDNFILTHFTEVVNKAKMFDGKFIIDILNTKFDIFNVLVLLKCKARNIPEEKRKKLLINNKTELSKRFEKIIKSKDLKELVEDCKGLPYYVPLSQALEAYEKDSSLSHFERQLYKFYKEFVAKEELNHFQGPYPVFAYLVKKELEQKNLMIVSKGIDASYKPEEIRELLV